MAYIEPKTNWVASNIPVASDLNRIEGNTKQNHDDIAAEAIAMADDIDAEEVARIASDLSIKLRSATGPGEYIAYGDDDGISSESTTYIKVFEYKVSGPVIYKMYFTLSSNVNGYATIYINGVQAGTERLVSFETDVVFSENIACSDGDLVQVYIKRSASELLNRFVSIKDFYICHNGYGKLKA